MVTVVVFGYSYSFQIPESWDINDQYRSLCYMRPLAIWAMQWALSKPKDFKEEMHHKGIEDESYLKQHAGFSKVAHLLRLPEEEAPKSFFQAVYEFTCKRMLF